MRTYIKFKYLLLIAFCFSFSFAQSQIQIVRIDFENPDGFTRQLALGFVEDNSATDGVDYGYDAPNIEDLQDDLNWIIEDNRYIIQGVGAFDTTKYYPLGMFLTNSGEVSISLNALENFQNSVNVYLYDLELDEYTVLNETDYTQNLSAGTYVNRYFVAFSNDAHLDISANYLLSLNENTQSSIKIWHSKANDELNISGLTLNENIKLTLYSIDGKIIEEQDISEKKTTLNTSEITDGIYLATIETSTFTHSAKVYITN
jgi:hypothetical protein